MCIYIDSLDCYMINLPEIALVSTACCLPSRFQRTSSSAHAMKGSPYAPMPILKVGIPFYKADQDLRCKGGHLGNISSMS